MEWFSIYKMITTVSLIGIRHHTELQNIFSYYNEDFLDLVC